MPITNHRIEVKRSFILAFLLSLHCWQICLLINDVGMAGYSRLQESQNAVTIIILSPVDLKIASCVGQDATFEMPAEWGILC